MRRASMTVRGREWLVPVRIYLDPVAGRVLVAPARPCSTEDDSFDAAGPP
jgi:hypothetical protein